MTGWNEFACCDASAASLTFLRPAGGPASMDDRLGPLLAENVEPAKPSREVAFHEAAHAVMARALGGTVTSATVSGQPHAAAKVAGGPESIAVALAGETADRWSRKWVYRYSDADLRVILGRIDNGGGGNCDGCRIARFALVLADPIGDLDAAIAVFRHVELQTIDLVRDPRIWSAIRALADALMECGTISETDIAAICDARFRAGSFKIIPLEKD